MNEYQILKQLDAAIGLTAAVESEAAGRDANPETRGVVAAPPADGWTPPAWMLNRPDSARWEEAPFKSWASASALSSSSSTSPPPDSAADIGKTNDARGKAGDSGDEIGGISATPGHVFVINLDRSTRRLANFENWWPADWPLKPPERFPGVDGDRLAVQSHWNPHAGSGAHGLRAALLNLLDLAIARQWRSPVLVMEDDCQWVTGYRPRLLDFLERLPADFEIAFLGCQHFRAPRPVTISVVSRSRSGGAGQNQAPGGIVRVTEAGRTHAMLIHPRFFGRLAKFWREGVAGCAPTHVDHMLQHWAKTDERRRFYAAKPVLAIQGPNFSEITRRQEPARSWDGDVPVESRRPEDVVAVILRAPAGVIAALRQRGAIHTGYWRDGQSDVDVGLTRIMNLPPGQRPREFAQWAALLRREAAAFANAALAIVHPNITTDLLDAAGVRHSGDIADEDAGEIERRLTLLNGSPRLIAPVVVVAPVE